MGEALAEGACLCVGAERAEGRAKIAMVTGSGWTRILKTMGVTLARDGDFLPRSRGHRSWIALLSPNPTAHHHHSTSLLSTRLEP